VKTFRFSFVLILLCAAAQAQTVFQLDPSKTEIHFTLHDVLHTVHGTFKLKRGTIQLDSETGNASGEIVIDVASGASGSESRDHRMHKEILESQRYPETVFTPAHVDGHIAPEGESQIDVQGTMQAVTSVVEGWIREYPEQWLWLHRRWRPEDRKPAEALP